MVPDDDTLAERIESAFEKRGLINDCDIEMQVEDGAVALNGTVPTKSRRKDVVDAVLSVAGVVSVECDVYVSEEGSGHSYEVQEDESRNGLSVDLLEEGMGWMDEGET